MGLKTKTQTNITPQKAIKARVQGAIRHGFFPEAPSLTKVFEKLVTEEMDRRGVPSEFND